MTAKINILLIDTRVSHYEAIIAAVDPALSKGITFDYYTDTFDTLKERMASSGVLANSVGLVQHNYKMPTFKMVDAQTTSSTSTIEQVEIQDSELSTWAPLKEFIEWCKTELSTAHFDMMACAIYSNPDWKYVIDTLSTQTGVEIRASTDDTGASSLGGNWFLESHVGVNLKEVYFNDSIDGYVGLLDSAMFNSSADDGFLYTTQIPTITTLPSIPARPTNPTLPLPVPTLPSLPSLSGYTTSYGASNEVQGNGGSVVSYGDDNNTNCSFSKVSTQLQSGVAYLFSSGAALKTNGSLVLWGNHMYSANIMVPSTANLSSGVCSMCSNGGYNICALKTDGSVVFWGNFSSGFPAFPSSDLSSGVNFVAASSQDFACLKSNGSIRGWGKEVFNTSSSVPTFIYPVGSNLDSGFVKLVSVRSIGAFAAIKTDGSVVFFGGTSSASTSYLSNPTTFYPPGSNITSGVVDVVSTLGVNYQACFIALKSDGSLVAWGAGASSLSTWISGKTAVKIIKTTTRPIIILSDGTYINYLTIMINSASEGVHTNIVDALESTQNDHSRYLFLRNNGTLAWWGTKSYYYSPITAFTNVVKMWNDPNGEFDQGAIVLTSTGQLRNLVNNVLMATDVNDAIVTQDYVTYVTSSGKVRVIKKVWNGSRMESVINNAPYPAIRANGAAQESATSLLATLNDGTVCTVLKTPITYPHLFVFDGTTYATCPYNQYSTALDLVTGYVYDNQYGLYSQPIDLYVGGNAFTIETWYYQPSQTLNSTIVDRGNYCYLFQVSPNANTITANLGCLGFYCNTGTWLYATNAVVATSGWTHIAMTRQGTSYKFYINGVLKQTMTGPEILNRDDGVFGIGTQLAGLTTTTASNFINAGCSMYDLRLWCASRTDDQIKSCMNVSVDPSSFGLVANYLFNDNENVFRDRTRNGFNCTIVSTILSNLVAQYNFDSNGNDSSSNNNTLTNVNTVTFNTSNYKRGSGAASFNGTNYFEIANDGRFSPDNFTVALWIKPVASSSDYQAIASCRNSPSPNLAGWMIYINPSNNLEFWTGHGSDWSSTGILLNGIGTINTWVHIAFTLSKSTNTVIFYVNGSLQSTITRIYVNNTTTNLRIGAGSNEQLAATFHLLNGTLIDDFRFYNKVLSASEIAAIVADSISWNTYSRNSKPTTSSPSSIGVFLNPDYTLVRQSYLTLDLGPGPLTNLVKTDFTGANLTGINFVGRDLTGVNFSGANLTNINFSNAILTGITVNKSTNFTGVNFTNTAIYSVIGTVNPSLVPTNYLHYLSNVNLKNVLVDYNNVNTSIALPPTSITNYAVHFAEYNNFKKSNARFYISWATNPNALSFSSSSYTPKVRFQIVNKDTNVVGVDVLFDYADGKGCIETNVPFYIDRENEGNGSISDTSPANKNIPLRFWLWGELVNGVRSSSYAEIVTGSLPPISSSTLFSLFSNILTTAPSWYKSITTNSNSSNYSNYIGYLNHSDNKLFLHGTQVFANGVISAGATFYDWATSTPYIIPATSGMWRNYIIDPTGNSVFINVWSSSNQGWCRYVFSTNTLTVLSLGVYGSVNNTVCNSTGTRAYANDIHNLLVYNSTTSTASVVPLGLTNLRATFIDKNDKYVVTSSYDPSEVYIINIVNDAFTKISTGQIVWNDTLAWVVFDDSSNYCYAVFYTYRGDIYRIKLSDGTWTLFKALPVAPSTDKITIINKYLYIFGINSSNQYSMIDTTDATRTVIVNSFPTGYDAVLHVYETKNNNVYCFVNYNGVPTIMHFTGFPNTFSNSSGIMLGPSMNYLNANLANYNLSNKNFTSSKFTNATLTRADFTNSNFTNASFSGTVDYSTAVLTGATLTGATFSDSLFDYTLDANNNATVVKYRGSASLVFPEKVSGAYTITAIADNMDWGLSFTNFSFSVTSKLVSIGANGGANLGIITSPFGSKNFFPLTLTTIGNEAFYNRTVASSPEFPTSNVATFAAIILPPSVNSIGTNAFSQFGPNCYVKIKPTLAWNSELTTSREIGSTTFTYTATSSGPVGYTGYNGANANSNMPVYYASTNTSIATINSSTGLVTLVGAGTVTFTANQDSQNSSEVSFYSADTITSAILTVTKGTPILSNVTVSKTYGTTVGPITIPTLAVTGFPVLNSLTNWTIDIGFTATGGANSWRALLGSMYNAVDLRGWGIWISSSNKIFYSHKNLTYDFTNGSVSINVAYNLNITRVGTSITFKLTNVSTQVSSTYTATNVTDPMGLGPVSIGGWVSGIETFPGTINYVVVKDHISIGNKVFQVTAPAGSSVSGGTMHYAFLSGDTTVASISDLGSITVNKAGTVVFSASQDETSSYNAPTPSSVTLTVSKATPILSNATVSKTFGDAAFQVTAPAGSSVSGGTMHYIFSSGGGDTTVASITDAGLITVNKAGTVVFSASQDFTTSYNSPLPVSVTLTVAKATPTLSGFTIPSQTYTYGTNTTFQVTATTSSGSNGTFRYSSNNSAVASINASGAVGTVTINGAGSATFTVNQDLTDNYNAPAPLTAILTVIKGTPTIAISNLSKSTIDPTFTFASSTASDGARTFSSNTPGVATIHPSSGLVTIVGIVGTTTITVSQAASTNYNAPSNATATLTVIKGTPILSAFSIAPKIFGISPFAVTAPASQNTVGAFYYTSDTLGVAKVTDGTTITIVGAGSATITANQEATTNFNAPTAITAILTVSKATPTIVVSNITKSSIDPTFTFARSTASDGALTFSSSAPSVATVNSASGVVTVVSAGTATITVSQVASTNYNAPTNATATLTVTAGTLTNAIIASGADLSGKNLSGASLVGATLANVVLSNSNLNGANFSGANVTGTDFTNASIVGATNLPTFSTKQKLELLYNANNAGANISQLQFSAPLSVSELNAALSVPIAELSSVNTEFLIAAPVYDASNVKTVAIAPSSISTANNTSIYIPLNKGETVKINGASFTLNASNELLDNNGVVLKLMVVNGYPFKIYSGSIIAVNISSRMNNITFDTANTIKLYDVVNSMVTDAITQEALSGLVAGYVSELYTYLNLSYVDVYNRNNPVLDATVTSPVFSSYASNTNTFSYSVIITGPAANPLSLDKTKYKFIVESVNTATNSRTTVSQPTWDSIASPTTIACASLSPLTSYSIIVTPTLFNSTSNLKSLLPVKTLTLTTPLDYGLISSVTFTKESSLWYFNFQYSGYASLTSFTMGLRWIQSSLDSGGYRFSISENFSSVPISNGTNKYLITDTQNYLNVGGPSLIANVVTSTIDYVSGTATKQIITTFVPNPIVGGPHVVVISNFNTEVYPGTCTATIPASLHNQIGGGKVYYLRFVQKETGTITNVSTFGSESSSSQLTIPLSLYGKTFTCELNINNIGYSYSGAYTILPYTSNTNYFTVPNPSGLFPTEAQDFNHYGIGPGGGAIDDLRIFRVTWLTAASAIGLEPTSPNYTPKVRVHIKGNWLEDYYIFTGVYNYADGFGYSIFHSNTFASLGHPAGSWTVKIRTENGDGTITNNYSTFTKYIGGVQNGVFNNSLSGMVASAGTATILYGENVASTFAVSNLALSAAGYTWNSSTSKYATSVAFTTAVPYGTSTTTHKHKVELINPDTTKITLGLFVLDNSAKTVAVSPLNPSSTYTVKVTLVYSAENDNYVTGVNASSQTLTLTVPAAQ